MHSSTYTGNLNDTQENVFDIVHACIVYVVVPLYSNSAPHSQNSAAVWIYNADIWVTDIMQELFWHH